MNEIHTETPSPTPSRRPSLWPALLVWGIAIAITAIAQYFAPQFDFQNANLIGLASIALATLFFGVSLHRRSLHAGRSWLIPGVTLGAIAVFFALFRFDGFSGEMLPLFRLRFGGETQHPLQKPIENATAALPKTDSPENSAQSTAADGENLEAPQFLGPNRNGVYPSRGFAIPESPDEIEVLWNQGIGEGWSSFAVQGGVAITLEQRDEDECLSCYRLSDGALLWIVKHPGRHENPLGGIGPRSTPTIVADRVYATTATGWLCCVHLIDGEVIWSRDILAESGWDQAAFEVAAPWGYACSPLYVSDPVTEDLCVVTLGGPLQSDRSASLVALSADTGEVVWKAGEDQLSYASPVLMTLDGERQIVSVNEKTVSGHRIEDGEVLWSFSWPGSTNTGANCASAVQVGDASVLVGKGYGGGSALVAIKHADADSAKREWSTQDLWRSHRILKTKFNHICVDGDVGYGISNGLLQAVNLTDETVYWNQPRSKRAAQGQVVLVDDTLVVQDETGDVVLVDATTDAYTEHVRWPALESKTWNIPAVSGRYILVRNDRQAICFRLPAPESDAPGEE